MSPWFPHSPAENLIMDPAQFTGRGENLPHQSSREEIRGWLKGEPVITAWLSKGKEVGAICWVLYIWSGWLCYLCWERDTDHVVTLGLNSWEIQKPANDRRHRTICIWTGRKSISAWWDTDRVIWLADSISFPLGSCEQWGAQCGPPWYKQFLDFTWNYPQFSADTAAANIQFLP